MVGWRVGCKVEGSRATQIEWQIGRSCSVRCLRVSSVPSVF